MTTARVKLGKHGEELASGYLRDAGCGILDANYRCPWGEIDLVARDGEELAFVEVRTRRSASFGTPRESVTRRKADHLVAAAQHYLQNRVSENCGEDIPWRIDLVSVLLTDGTGYPQIDHIKYAVQG